MNIKVFCLMIVAALMLAGCSTDDQGSYSSPASSDDSYSSPAANSDSASADSEPELNCTDNPYDTRCPYQPPVKPNVEDHSTGYTAGNDPLVCGAECY